MAEHLGYMGRDSERTEAHDGELCQYCMTPLTRGDPCIVDIDLNTVFCSSECWRVTIDEEIRLQNKNFQPYKRQGG